MVLLLIMTFGRLGSVSGNLVLPVFMQLSCLAPFLWLVSLMTSEWVPCSKMNINLSKPPLYIVAFLFSLFLKFDDQQALS